MANHFMQANAKLCCYKDSKNQITKLHNMEGMKNKNTPDSSLRSAVSGFVGPLTWRLTSDECSVSTRTMSVKPLLTAMWSAVHIELFRRLTFAPLLNSNRAISAWLLKWKTPQTEKTYYSFISVGWFHLSQLVLSINYLVKVLWKCNCLPKF